jgi:hypothetical protein
MIQRDTGPINFSKAFDVNKSSNFKPPQRHTSSKVVPNDCEMLENGFDHPLIDNLDDLNTGNRSSNYKFF